MLKIETKNNQMCHCESNLNIFNTYIYKVEEEVKVTKKEKEVNILKKKKRSKRWKKRGGGEKEEEK